jgi:hypothetical protein
MLGTRFEYATSVVEPYALEWHYSNRSEPLGMGRGECENTRAQADRARALDEAAGQRRGPKDATFEASAVKPARTRSLGG